MSYKYDVFVLSEKLYWKNTHSHINDAKFNDKKMVPLYAHTQTKP